MVLRVAYLALGLFLWRIEAYAQQFSKAQELTGLCASPYGSARYCKQQANQSVDEASMQTRIDLIWADYSGDPGTLAAGKRMFADWLKQHRVEFLTKEQIAAAEKVEWDAEHPSVETLRSMEIDQVCSLARGNRYQLAMDELRRRNRFTPSDLLLIQQKKIALRMSEEAMLCSWGQSRSHNRTVTANRVLIQWVYGDTYVYTENGLVTSWQD